MSCLRQTDITVHLRKPDKNSSLPRNCKPQTVYYEGIALSWPKEELNNVVKKLECGVGYAGDINILCDDG